MSDTMDTPEMGETTEAPEMSEISDAPAMGETMDAPQTDDAMNGRMKAISQDELGGPEVLKLVTLPTPEPGVSEILIRVHAAGVNPIDGAIRETGAFVGQPPFVLGWDVSGTVEAVGPGVTLYKPGDEVFGLLPFPQGHGAYAQYVVGPTRAFVPKPDRLDHVQAAAIPTVGLTAWQALVDTARVGEGSRVLITGAAGGIGHLAVQIAKARGRTSPGWRPPTTSTSCARSAPTRRSITTGRTSRKLSATPMSSWMLSAAITPPGPWTFSGEGASSCPPSPRPWRRSEKSRPNEASAWPASSPKQTKSACPPWPISPPPASSFRPLPQPSLWRRLRALRPRQTSPRATDASL